MPVWSETAGRAETFRGPVLR